MDFVKTRVTFLSTLLIAGLAAAEDNPVCKRYLEETTPAFKAIREGMAPLLGGGLTRDLEGARRARAFADTLDQHLPRLSKAKPPPLVAAVHAEALAAAPDTSKAMRAIAAALEANDFVTAKAEKRNVVEAVDRLTGAIKRVGLTCALP